MSLQNYEIAQNTTEAPRKTEYRLFAQVTKSLMDIDNIEDSKLAKAILWNRRLWMTLQADCSDESNILSDQTRAGIISLAIWVDKHSRDVLRGEAEVAPLIEVNRSIMEGLAA
jgi:flagellar protein FlaF